MMERYQNPLNCTTGLAVDREGNSIEPLRTYENGDLRMDESDMMMTMKSD